MSKKIIKKLSTLALAILSLGIVFLMLGLVNLNSKAEESLSDNSVNFDQSEAWVDEIVLGAASITNENHFGKTCMVIDSAEDLAQVAYEVSQGTNSSYTNGYFYLAQDINLRGKLWTPIGTTTHPFSGTFFGNGYKISNVVISQASIISGNDIGLFGAVTGSIVDLTVEGAFGVSSLVDSSTNNIGHIAGSLQSSGEIINCFDEMIDPLQDGFKSIGNTASSAKVIYPSSRNGIEEGLTTIEEMQSKISFNGTPQTGYSVYYNTNVAAISGDIEGTGVGFYQNGNYIFSGNKEESQQVRVAFANVSEDTYSSIITLNNPLYFSQTPLLRESAVGSQVYVLRTGYKATFSAPSLENSGIVNISWNKATVNVSYNYGYGSRTVNFETPYDSPWTNVIATKEIVRLGYQSNTLYSESSMQTLLNTTDRANYVSYYAKNGDCVYIKWSDPKNLTGKLYVGADTNEGGSFKNPSASNAYSNLNVSGADVLSQSSNYSDLSNIIAGQDVVINFSLNAGYTFQLAGLGTNLTAKSSWDGTGITNLTTGAYTYYPNSTGKDSDGQSYIIGTDGGYYDAYTPIEIKVEKSDSNFTITIKNIVDNGGEIVLLFGREQKEISIQGTGLDRLSSATIINHEASQTSLDWESKTITTKIGESFDFVVSSVGEDYFILSRSVNGFVCDNIIEEEETPVGESKFYQKMTFEINAFAPEPAVEDYYITLNINRLLTYIKVQIGEEGKFFDNVAENRKATVSVSSSGIESMSTNSQVTLQVPMTTNTTITFNANGFYSLASVDGASVPFENNAISQTFSKFSNDPSAPAYIITFNPTKNYYNLNIVYMIDGIEVSKEIAEKFVKFNGKTSSLDFEQTENYSLTLTESAKTWLKYDFSIQASDLGNNSTGYQASVLEGASSGLLNASFDSENATSSFNYKPGTFNSTLTINLSRKEINVNFNNLTLNDDDKTILPDSSSLYGSMTLKYDYNGTGSLNITGGGFSSISIENGYYLVGWYLTGGKTITAFSNNDLIQDVEFRNFISQSASGNKNSPITVSVSPLVEKRVVKLSYSANGEGEQQGVSANDLITAPEYVYGSAPIVLSTEKFKKIGYRFNSWSTEFGTISDNQYSLTGNAWNTLWENSAGQSKHSWTSFASSDEEKYKNVILTAQFEALVYTISVDSLSEINISIGQTINFVAAGNGEYATYTNNETQAVVTGSSLAGYTAKSFVIKGNITPEVTENSLTSFVLSLENIKKFISEENYYSVSETAELTINTEREANTYKIYIQSNSNKYYTVSLAEGTTEEQGGIDSTERTYILVKYNETPANLDKVSVVRNGYKHVGFTYNSTNFDASQKYTITSDITIIPKFERDEESDFVKNQIVLTESDVFKTQNKVTGKNYEFYLVSGTTETIISANNISNFGNGDIVSEQLFKSKNSEVSRIGRDISFDYIINKVMEGIFDGTNIELQYVVTIIDSLSGETYDLTYDVHAFSILPNEIVFENLSLKTYYTGTSDYLATEDSDFGNVLDFKYDLNGEVLLKEEQNTELINNFINTNRYQVNVSGDDYNVGTKNVRIIFNGTDVGNNVEYIWSNVKSESKDSFYVDIENGIEIVTSPAVITFNSSTGIYVEGLVQTIAQNVSNQTFNVLSNPKYQFTYSFDSLILKNNVVGTYTGSEDHTLDKEKFVVTNFVVKNGQEVVTGNFEWVISKNSTYQVVGGEDFNAVEYRYEPRYFTASNGSLTGITEGWGELGRENIFTISELMFDGVRVEPNNGANFASQYNHIVNEKIYFTIIGNNSSKLVIKLNNDLIGGHTITFNITVSDALEEGLVLYSWQNNLDIDDSIFGSIVAEKTIDFEYGTTTEGSHYAIYTNATKVNVNYNLSGIENETIYVAYGKNYDLSNPTDSASELTFNGYQLTGSGLSIADSEGKKVLSNTSSGSLASLKAKWTLSNVSVSQLETEFTISPLGVAPTNDFDFTTIFSTSSQRASLSSDPYTVVKVAAESEDVALVLKGNKATLPYVDSESQLINVASNQGEYKISITFAYNDSFETSYFTKEITFTINVVKDELTINNLNTLNGSLTFANIDYADTFKVGYSLTSRSFSGETTTPIEKTISQLSDNAIFNMGVVEQKDWINQTNYFNVSITTPYSTNDMYYAGEYSFDFALWDIWENYVSIKANTDTYLTQTVNIAKYTIKLADYNDKISTGKLVGLDDPDVISDTITITETNNDEVVITFSGRENEDVDVVGSYKLLINKESALSEEDKKNYDLNVDGFEAYFVIAKNENGQVVVTLPNGFHMTYNGSEINSFEVAVVDKKFVLKAMFSTEAKQTIDLQVKILVGDQQYDVAQSAMETLAGMIEIAFASDPFAKDYKEGGYSLNASLSGDATGDFKSIAFGETSDSKFYIDKAPITLKQVEKTFDKTADFTEKTVISFNGAIGDEVLDIEGRFASAHAGSQSLESLSITGNTSQNYYIENADFKGTILAKAVSTVTVEIGKDVFVYGQISQRITLEQLLEMFGTVTVNIDGDILTIGSNEFVNIQDFVIENAQYSTTKKLSANKTGYNFFLTLSSTDYTGLNGAEGKGQSVNVVINQKVLDLSATEISKVYDGTTNLPSDIDWVGFEDVESGDVVSVDTSLSQFVSKDKGTDIAIDIVFTGADASNYREKGSVVGDITAVRIILKVNVTENLPNDNDGSQGFIDGDKEIINSGLEIVINYPFDEGQDLNSIINSWAKPSRVGYDVTGYSYKTESGSFEKLTVDNLPSFLEKIAVAEGEKSAYIYPNWERQSFTVTISGNNIASLDSLEGLSSGVGDITSGSITYNIGYYESFSFTVKTKQGYKVSEFVISNTYVSKEEGKKGTNSCSLAITNVTGNTTINIETTSITISFVIDKNIPVVEGVNIVETSSDTWTNKTINYSEILEDQELVDFLPKYTVTDWTFDLVGFKNGENLVNVDSEELLKAYIDANIDHSTDAIINLTAQWQGQTYTIHFDANGGRISDNYDATAVFGGKITLPEDKSDFPVAVMEGKVSSYYDALQDGKPYTKDTTFTTIGANNEVTFYAVWSDGIFDITFDIDSKVTVKLDGNPLQNTTKQISYSETWTFEISSNEGYSFKVDLSDFHGSSSSVTQSPFTINNVIADSTIKFVAVPKENTLTITYDSLHIESIVVDEVEYSEPVEKLTGTEVTIVVTAKEGYEFDNSSASLIGNSTGKIDKVLSEENTVLTLTWKDFTTDGTISLTAKPKSINISWGKLSSYASDISINNQSLTLDDGSFSTRVGQELSVTITLKYGYENANLTSQNATIENENNSSLDSNKIVTYTATIKDFTQDFVVSLTADARKWTVSVSVADYGEEDRGQAQISPDGENNLVFGSSVTLTANASSVAYRFIGWYQGDVLYNENASFTIDANLENKTLLESGNLNFEARFDYNAVDLTFSSGVNGKLEVRVNNGLPFVVEEGTSQTKTVFVNDKVVIVFFPNSGYELDTFKADDDDKTLDISGNSYTFDVVANSYSSFSATFKASEVYVDVKVAVQINFVNYEGLEDGGKLYLVDNLGNILDDGYLQPSSGDLVKGINYKVLTYTDQSFYLMAESNPGYSFSLDVKSGFASIDQITLSNGKTIYKVSNAQDLSSLMGIFKAEEQRVEIMFVTDEESSTIAAAGKIQLTNNTVPANASGNNSEHLTIVTITGADIELSLSTNFYYKLISDEDGNVSVVVTGSQSGFAFSKGIVQEIDAEETMLTGFTYTSTLSLTGVNSNITIKILVEPISYNLKFFIDEDDSGVYDPITINNLIYGQNIDLSSLTSEERNRLTKSRDGFTLMGYYTKQLMQGTQYLDSQLMATNIWLEKPYIFDGSKYKENSNFDAETKTFTLYAGWSYDKAKVTVDFIPDALKDLLTEVSISDIITNINQTISWVSPDNVWVGEFSVASPLTLELSAFVFDGYQFAYWVVENEDKTIEYTNAKLSLTEMNKGDYTITAIYYPKYSITIESNNTTDPSLVGNSYIMQKGVRVEKDCFDSTLPITLVAEEGRGYSFVYWTDKEGNIYQGTETSNGHWEYSLGLRETPIYLTAVFEGDNVGMKLDLTDFSHGTINRVLHSGQEIENYLEEFTVKIGDKIEIELQTENGYGVDFEGANFTYDINTDRYYYVVRAEDLQDGSSVHEGIVIIKPISTEKEITFTFELKVEDSAYLEDATINSLIRFTYTLNNQILANTTVSEGTVIENLLFGGTATLNIVSATNYTVGRLIISVGSSSIDLTDKLNKGLVYIQIDVLSELFEENTPYVITIDFTKMIWSEEAYRSQSLEGEGSMADPYLIKNAADMGFVAWAVNNGIRDAFDNLYSECRFKVVADIDFQGKYWEPIGTKENPFNGIMDLGDYNISNINFVSEYINPSPSYNGLFWILGEDAVIIQTNNVLVIVLSIVGGVLLLVAIIIISFIIARRRKKKRYEELANG